MPFLAALYMDGIVAIICAAPAGHNRGMRVVSRDAQITLVLGGARSGKSRYAESLATTLPPPWIYVATAEPLDAEMDARIAEHRSRRGSGWQTMDAPRDLAGALTTIPVTASSILVDCLTLWLSNLMLAKENIDSHIKDLEDALAEAVVPVVLVANEVGLGIVPDNALARCFRDQHGRLNQRIAARADRVVMLVAGLPIAVKGTL